MAGVDEKWSRLAAHVCMSELKCEIKTLYPHCHCSYEFVMRSQCSFREVTLKCHRNHDSDRHQYSQLLIGLRVCI